MSIGTSLGAYYDDEHHRAAAEWDMKYDENEAKNRFPMRERIDKEFQGQSELDQDLIRNPIEVSPDTNPRDAMTPEKLMEQNMIVKDPGNVYNDAGDIVDWKPPGSWGEPDLPIMRHKEPIPKLEPRSFNEFNELDALADKDLSQ